MTVSTPPAMPPTVASPYPDSPRVLATLDRVGYGGWLMAELDEAKRPAREFAGLANGDIEETPGLSPRRQALPTGAGPTAARRHGVRAAVTTALWHRRHRRWC